MEKDFDRSAPMTAPESSARTNAAKSKNNGLVLCTVSVLLILVMIFEVPSTFANAIYGSLGIYALSLFVLLFFVGLGIRYKRAVRMRRRYFLLGSLMIFALFTGIHLAFTYKQLELGVSFADYLKYGFDIQTPGGALFAIPSFVLHVLCQLEGSFITLGVIFIISTAFITTDIVTSVGENAVVTRIKGGSQDYAANSKMAPSEYKQKTKELEQKVEEKYQQLLERQSKSKLNKAKSELGITAPPVNDPSRAIYDSPIPLNQLQPDMPNGLTATEEITNWSTMAAEKFNEGLGIPDFLPNKGSKFAPYSANQAVNYQPQMPAYPTPQSFGQAQSYTQPQQNFGSAQPFSQPQNYGTVQQYQQPLYSQPQPLPQAETDVTNLRISRRLEAARSRMNREGGNIDDRINARGEQMKMDVPAEKPQKPYKPRRYIKPPIEIIRTESSNLSDFHIEAMEKQKLLDEKLKEFGVNAKVTSFTIAPAVTRFEVQLASGVRVSQVEQLSKEMSLVLGGVQVRIELVEGKNAIGIEVPNKKVAIVSIKDIIATRDFAHHQSPLAVAIGKNLNNEPIIGDITTMPHLLIAGSTGSGKSVCLNTVLTSLLFKAHPDEVKLLLVDTKRVELNLYNEVPHMLIPHTIKEVPQVINALKWMAEEMRRRYKILEQSGTPKISLYHSLPAYQNGILERMPYIIMVIDEAADVMRQGGRDVENALTSLSSLARACGMHIILATQRPSVDVITSVIKTNFPVKIAFKVGTQGDSRTIINVIGAEKLVGRGDMLYSNEGVLNRVQCGYIESEEIRRVMNYIRENNQGEFDSDLEDSILNGPPAENAATGFGDADGVRGAGGRGGQDPMFVQVLKWLVRDENLQRIASISGFQRQFGIGFARAGKIIDQLADAGYVSSGAGTKARQVLVTREEVENMYGEL